MWILGGRPHPIGVRGLYSMIDKALYNPLTTVAISKLMEMIYRSTYILACSISTALDSDINQTAMGGHLSEHAKKSMHACHSVSVGAGQPERAGDTAK